MTRIKTLTAKRKSSKSKRTNARLTPTSSLPIIYRVKNSGSLSLTTCARVLAVVKKKPLNPLRHERLHYEPPIFEVIVELREQLFCPKGCKGQWISAEKPKHILPKARFTESILAHIIVSKLEDRQPYYHLEKQFESRAGFKFTRQTMARSAIECAASLQPLVNLFKDQIIEHNIAVIDPSMLQVLKEPGRPPT